MSTLISTKIKSTHYANICWSIDFLLAENSQSGDLVGLFFHELVHHFDPFHDQINFDNRDEDPQFGSIYGSKFKKYYEKLEEKKQKSGISGSQQSTASTTCFCAPGTEEGFGFYGLMKSVGNKMVTLHKYPTEDACLTGLEKRRDCL